MIKLRIYEQDTIRRNNKNRISGVVRVKMLWSEEQKMTISERIFKLIEEREITQNDFSKATGIAQSSISDWKRKKTNPSADKIMIICKVLKVTPYELLQDTAQSVEELDYRVVTKGTKEYNLLLEMESLEKSQKERLLGYIEALKQ